MFKTDKADLSQFARNEIELVDFRLYEDRDGEAYEGVYGINVAKVSSIIMYPDEVYDTPGCPEYMIGMFDLRGSILPLIDLTKWMNIKPKEDAVHEKKVIVAEFSNKQLGFIVHATRRLRRISWEHVEPAMFSLSNDAKHGKVTGTTRIEDGRTLLILDIESIIDDLDYYVPSSDKCYDIESSKPKEKFEGTVLIVDDSMVARKLLHGTMESVGFRVIDAGDGKEALERLEKLYEMWGSDITKHLRLIITDVEMPRMDGYNFTAQVKNDSRFSDIPIIFNSSISDKFSAIKGKEIGAEAYLVKFDAKVFYDEITRILSKK